MDKPARRGRLYFAQKDQDIKELSDNLDRATISLRMAYTMRSSQTMEYIKTRIDNHLLQPPEPALASVREEIDRPETPAFSAIEEPFAVTVPAKGVGKKGKPAQLNFMQSESYLRTS